MTEPHTPIDLDVNVMHFCIFYFSTYVSNVLFLYMLVISCREKALFLLKFAGLSKFASRKQSSHTLERRHSILNRQSKTLQRQESIEHRKNVSIKLNRYLCEIPC